MASSKVLQEQVDLETLHYIFNQFSEDVSNDCCKIIIKVLKSLSMSMFCKPNFQDVKVFASVKLLLTLYENLNLNCANCKSELPISIIVESLKYVFECNNGNCRLPESDIQLNILSIVPSMFKSGLLLNSSRSLKELINFYNYNLTCISAIVSEKECKSDCLVFKLKIMTSIYQSLTNINCEPLVAGFYEELKSVNELEECELFADLIFHADDEIASQALLHLIPAYINCFKSGRIIKIIWERISTCLICDIWNSRVLIVLCHIFDLGRDKFLPFEDKADVLLLLLEDINYWKLVQYALQEKDQVKRKQGLYLFKKAVNMLNENIKNHFCSKDKNIFYWHLDYKNELYKIYSEIILILEFLEEQQIHLVKPIFNLINTLTENILDSNKVDYSWVLVVFRRALLHESLQVVKWGLTNFLELPEKFFLDEHIARETAKMLAGTLNNMSLFYNNGLTISKELRVFFDKITQLHTSKIFFSSFIKEICSQVWSAEALFFVIHPLSGVRRCPAWGKEEISEILIFVLKAFKTHHKVIRTGVQRELLKACMNFTDHENVPLGNITSLICIFFERGILKMGNGEWNSFVCWLRSSYCKQEAKALLEKYITEKSREEPNYMSLMFILFYYIYDICFCDSDEESISSNDKNQFALKYFQKILLLYKEINKRLYCDKLIHDQNLLIICSIYKANLKNSIPEFIKPTLPFLKDVILYIQTQLSKVSDLQDYNDWELYLSTFENIIKTLVLLEFDIEFTKHLYIEIIEDLKSSLESNLIICSVGKFWRIKFLNIMLKLPMLELKHSFLNSYILKTVNEPLEKDNNHSEKTRDLLNLWGRINSEFLEEKWKIFEYLINNRLIIHGSVRTEESCWISNDDLFGLCVEALDTGGYGVLCPVISVLKNLLPVMEIDQEEQKLTRTISDSVWKLIMERKKTEEFKVLIKQFIEMVFQEALINKESMREILLKYVDSIFSNPSLAVVNIFMKHIQQLDRITELVPLFCHIIGKGLIFGQVEKRDERLTNTVCSHIEFLKILSVQEISDFNTSNEIRARAIQRILQLDKKFPVHQTIARELIDTLLKIEEDLNKNLTRYFGNSHVHRIKHRIMQALLLLEPILNQNEDSAIKLSKRVFQFLLSENSQPSVRYMQEWLLIRMIVRHSEVYNRIHINNYYDSVEESKKKGACSLIAIIYHSCQLISSDLMEGKIASGISSILEFCFHRHFELRLYAQVAFISLYEFAKKKNFIKITLEHKNVYEALSICFEKELRKNKNLFKLMNNFYFKNFHPLNNYSLETIYEDLPRLTNVGSDEWISLKIFCHCGIDANETNVPLKDSSSFSLKSVIQNDWLPKAFESLVPTEFLDQKQENFLDNYQKKMIPIKPLTPGWSKDNSYREIIGNDGLIVVASLIDRIPNLGGLARTCEVFGASQYIINSLKHIDDKQFTSLSVTAEKWITVKEVKIQDLIQYVSEMKRNGYSIIGAEQALHSQPLNSVKFPKKTLLLLGNEKEGIPPNLLPFLDICVEIPQLGLIRSLNVHVSGALFIWEYAKQHHFS